MTQLQQLLNEANYDDALSFIHQAGVRALLDGAVGPLDRVRHACMISDVLDYGGYYDRAKETIEEFGREAERELSVLNTEADFSIAAQRAGTAYVKQQCWALMMWGMSFYRHPAEGYTAAMNRFELAKRILLLLKQSNLNCTGSLARAWYCIGLVHRQRKDYRFARTAFSQCVELAGIGIEARIRANQQPASFDYNLARCYGLGIGWIAYDEALLSEAKAALVVAERQLIGKKARFISAYVDVVHACVMLSAAAPAEMDRIDEAIRRLKKAYAVLAPGNGEGHPGYALRAGNELAQALLRRSRAVPGAEKETNLREAEKYLAKVMTTPATDDDKRTRSTAMIITSRILRERGQYRPALEAAFKARQIAGGLTFSQIDSYITVGEANYELKEYGAAIGAFQDALHVGRHSRKIVAVCHLHLSRTYLANNQPSKASYHFSQWEAIEPDLENTFILDLGKKVRQMIEPVRGDFRIRKSVGNLTAKPHIYDLHRWLAKTAMARTGDDLPRAAEMLGMGAATVQMWLQQGTDNPADDGA